MKTHDYSFFWSWEPVMMTRLLGEAVAAGIEKKFAADLARRRLQLAFADDGERIPLLQITLLDKFSIVQEGKQIFTIDDFTASQRQILGLLLTVKGQILDQEKAQLYFWPDSPPPKAKAKFDVLLGRLRKNISKHIVGHVHNYLILRKGFLVLHNTQIDLLQFMDASNAFLAHSRKNEWWQAGNAFHQAYSLWKGSLPSDIFTNEYAASWERILQAAFTEICLVWSRHLAESGGLDEAVLILENLLMSQVFEERAVSLLCSLYIQNNMPFRIRDILKRYKAALAQIDYSEEEIEKIIVEMLPNARNGSDSGMA